MATIRAWIENLLSTDRRKSPRYTASRLVAYYWDGGAPVPHRIRDITPQGAYLLTEQRWYPGTVVSMTLQTDGEPESGQPGAISVQAKVIRSGADGVGLRFLVPESGKPSERVLEGEMADRRAILRFLQSLGSDGGEASISTALSLAMPAAIFLFRRHAARHDDRLYLVSGLPHASNFFSGADKAGRRISVSGRAR
jgi:hypothetical protein